MAIWILNGVHCTSDYHLYNLAKQTCPEVLKDPNAHIQPLMYEVGVYFLCDMRPDINYFHQHGRGNCPPIPPDDDAKPEPENSLKSHVQLILEQMFYDILQESPNRKSHSQKPWTNIPLTLREEHVTEDLYLRLEFPFDADNAEHKVYKLCTRFLFYLKESKSLFIMPPYNIHESIN
ncbi:hypothetical protein L210DRAFT_3507781 [Boletus edulis BED1]|uniref:Uncharacterized protein n=1 Tax=Boletus edulis BED1 TaxID=1328754 RepID=A0AAD4BIA1_BOLED|nr:hypothetical protein L210DRAFT_3507781 [Boletus edulis BED1]